MFNLTLVTPNKKIETDLPVTEVIVPGYRGQLDILPGHAPLMTTLSTGVLQYKPEGSSEFRSVVLSWGYCEVVPTGVNILAETAELPEEIDAERAEVALKRSHERLAMAGLPTDDITKHQRKIQRARTRLHVTKGDTTH